MTTSRRDFLHSLMACGITVLSPATARAALGDDGKAPRLLRQTQELLDAIGQRTAWNQSYDYQRVFKSLGVRSEPQYLSSDGEHVRTWTIAYDNVDLALSFKTFHRPSMERAAESLIGLARRFREVDAAEVFRTAGRYDPAVGGDGVALVSSDHPTFNGKTWSNRFDEAQPLTPDSVDRACRHIARFVNDSGFPVQATPKALLVHPLQLSTALEDSSKRGRRPLTVIEWEMIDPRAWFVLTDADGLIACERQPPILHAKWDPKTNKAMIVASDQRGFGCYNPRALFGSI